MQLKTITEEMGVHKDWYVQAKKQTLESLPAFLSHLMNDYNHDYGTICHAITAGGIATMCAMNNHEQGGITGFQAGAVMWEFIRNWNYEHNKLGMKLLDYDKLLYSQYEYTFNKTIPKSTWTALQEQAKFNLQKEELANDDVKAHWQKIADGHVPFGFVVEND